MPEDVIEQISFLPRFEKRMQITQDLFASIGTLLSINGIDFDLNRSCYRAKDDGRIIEKLKRKGVGQLIYDIYGLRIVTEYPDRNKIATLIQSSYPHTPSFFRGDRPTVVDFSDPSQNANFRRKFNPSITPDYRSLHINIVFSLLDVPCYSIAQVQIRDFEEYSNLGPTSRVYRQNQQLLESSQEY